MPGWFHPGRNWTSVVWCGWRELNPHGLAACRLSVIKQVTPVYASSANRIASTLPGPFLESVFFFGRDLMMLIAARIELCLQMRRMYFSIISTLVRQFLAI
jgi:hypothetical protein